MGASTLKGRRGEVGQGASVVDCGHGALSTYEVRCFRRWCVAAFFGEE